MEHLGLVIETVIVSATVVLIMAILLNKSVLSKLCNIIPKRGYRPFSPNWITTYRIVVAFVGFYLYVNDHVLYGIALIALGAGLDRIDGKIAHTIGISLPHPATWFKDEQGKLTADASPISDPKNKLRVILGEELNSFSRFWIEFNFPGSTDLGKVFDSIIDKTQIAVLMAYFSLWSNGLNVWLVGLMFIPEIVGTLIRRPFLPESKKEWIHQEKASGIGKVKAVSQWVIVLLCVPLNQGWIDDTHWASGLTWLPNAVLGFTIILAFLSVMSRLKYFRQNSSVNHVIEVVEEAIGHQ